MHAFLCLQTREKSSFPSIIRCLCQHAEVARNGAVLRANPVGVVCGTGSNTSDHESLGDELPLSDATERLKGERENNASTERVKALLWTNS